MQCALLLSWIIGWMVLYASAAATPKDMFTDVDLVPRLAEGLGRLAEDSAETSYKNISRRDDDLYLVPNPDEVGGILIVTRSQLPDHARSLAKRNPFFRRKKPPKVIKDPDPPPPPPPPDDDGDSHDDDTEFGDPDFDPKAPPYHHDPDEPVDVQNGPDGLVWPSSACDKMRTHLKRGIGYGDCIYKEMHGQCITDIDWAVTCGGCWNNRVSPPGSQYIGARTKIKTWYGTCPPTFKCTPMEFTNLWGEKQRTATCIMEQQKAEFPIPALLRTWERPKNAKEKWIHDDPEPSCGARIKNTSGRDLKVNATLNSRDSKGWEFITPDRMAIFLNGIELAAKLGAAYMAVETTMSNMGTLQGCIQGSPVQHLQGWFAVTWN